MPNIWIFNTTIATTPGLTYKTRKVGIREARSLVFGKQDEYSNSGDVTVILVSAQESDVISAIGHDSTAAIASKILNRNVPVNRIEAKMQDGDIAVCIKLRGRAPEGVILSEDQINEIGYDIVVMEASDSKHLQNRMLEMEQITYLLAFKDWTEDTVKWQGLRSRRIFPGGNEIDYICRNGEGEYFHICFRWGEQVWWLTKIEESEYTNYVKV